MTVVAGISVLSLPIQKSITQCFLDHNSTHPARRAWRDTRTGVKSLVSTVGRIASTLSNGGCPATLLFPPQQRKILHETVLREILQERVSSSRNRVNPRGVKRKMSNYKLRPRKRGRTRRVNFDAGVRIIK